MYWHSTKLDMPHRIYFVCDCRCYVSVSIYWNATAKA